VAAVQLASFVTEQAAASLCNPHGFLVSQMPGVDNSLA
jgi:hypothetical protein